MRGKQLFKFLKAIDLISRPHGATIEDLSDELELDRRSIYRLLNLIGEFGFPIYDDKDSMERKKRWKFQDDYLLKLPNITLPDLKFSLSEIIALYLLRGHEKTYKGTEIEKKIGSAFSKIDIFVPDGLSANLEKIKTLFTPTLKFSKDYTGKEEVIDKLTEAILQQRTSLVKYHSFDQDKICDFKIDPLSFFENKGGLYTFVKTTSFGDIRTLAVERIQELEITDATFEYPDNFDPEEKLESAFDIVCDDPVRTKIWFSSDQAKYIKERTWAKEQKITEQKDGSIILEMKTSGHGDVKRWVMSYGADAKVIEPEELHDEVLSDLKKSIEYYEEVFSDH